MPWLAYFSRWGTFDQPPNTDRPNLDKPTILESRGRRFHMTAIAADDNDSFACRRTGDEVHAELLRDMGFGRRRDE